MKLETAAVIQTAIGSLQRAAPMITALPYWAAMRRSGEIVRDQNLISPTPIHVIGKIASIMQLVFNAPVPTRQFE
ncbi:MAG: hypothetical protein OXD01_03525 [Gammaproteobacteria bacterium]|nr:hypothetical protein [Gammaproteobacteria bacterium]